LKKPGQARAGGAPRSDPEAVAVCALASVPGVGAATLARMEQRFQSLQEAVRQGPARLLACEDLELDPAARQYLSRGPDLSALGTWALQTADKAGARVVLLGEEQYPGRLCRMSTPPRLLYVRGHLPAAAKRVAVVGSRDVDEPGRDLAQSFGDGLARAGVEVVSGGARGIDTAAHEGALWGEGRSIAVLGSGIDVPYPAENAPLFDRLAGGAGAVISELPPGAGPQRSTFPRRNRIVAGLADAVVVVRARAGSGALITARLALRCGTKVFAVPGDPANPRAEGPNVLLRDGQARIATGPADVLSALGWPVPEVLKAPPAFPPADLRTWVPGPGASDRAVIDEAGVRLWQLLDGSTPAHVDDLALRAQIPAREALGKLAELELKGMAVQRPGKYFLRR
jgi:DNA processing protein